MGKQVEIEDFDQILSHVGGWSYYQALILLLSLPFAMMLAFATYTPVLFLYAPPHTCKSPDMGSDNLHCSVIVEGQVIHYFGDHTN